MVVFTCNHCGDSLQKPRVEKHYNTTCRRNPKSLTCVDCLKDFRLEEYASHTKCITETERYAAKGTVVGPPKGEKKQQSWIESVYSVIEEERKNVNGNIINVFDLIGKHNNIPKKKKPFVNFLMSASGRKLNINDIEIVWDILEKKIKQNNNQQNEETKNGDQKSTAENVTENFNENNDEKSINKTKKSKKRKSEMEPTNEDQNIPEIISKCEEIKEEGNSEKSKKKKRKSEINENSETTEENKILKETNNLQNGDSTTKEKSKKKRKSQIENGETNGYHTLEETNESPQNGENTTEEKSKKKKKRKSQLENSETSDHQESAEKKTIEETKTNTPLEDMTNDNLQNGDSKTEGKSKRKKRKSQIDNGEANDQESPEKKIKTEDNETKIKTEENGTTEKITFSWEDTIREILMKKPEGISRDKLENKVLKKYEKVNGAIENRDKLVKKYNKKLKSVKDILCDNDFIKISV